MAKIVAFMFAVLLLATSAAAASTHAPSALPHGKACSSLEQGCSIDEGQVEFPVFGKVDTSRVSLGLFTLVIAGLDGFNPCAFFVLMFLLSLLIHARSRKRILYIGGTFVFFSGLIYFLFMSAWLNVFMLIGRISLITAVAGGWAIVFGVINVKDYFFFKEGPSLTISSRTASVCPFPIL